MLDLKYGAPKGSSQTLVVTLRVLVALVMAALAAALPVVWILAIEVVSGAPEFAWLCWPYLAICVAAGFTLLMVVMRQLLMQVTALRTELSEVI